jgi:hypothetical protein
VDIMTRSHVYLLQAISRLIAQMGPLLKAACRTGSKNCSPPSGWHRPIRAAVRRKTAAASGSIRACRGDFPCYTPDFVQKKVFALGLLLLAGSLPAAERTFDFNDALIGQTPPGFRSTLSGSSGKPGEWKIILDEFPSVLPPISPQARNVSKRPVLAQVARDRADEHFPLLIFDDEVFGDFKLTTRFKIVDGVEEQMAGIAFRIQDEKNYYYLRASALGNTFYLVKYVDAFRSDPLGAKVEISRGVWHEMALECKGEQIRAWLDGRDVIPAVADSSFKSQAIGWKNKLFSSGKIGFWTKSDSVSYFADTRVTYTPREILAQTLVRDTLKRYPRLQGLKIFFPTNSPAGSRIIASSDLQEVGQPGHAPEQDVIANSRIYHGREKESILVTLPLRDCNGETIAAVKVVMKRFPGQTEKNAIARALHIVKQLEARVQSANELTQ